MKNLFGGVEAGGTKFVCAVGTGPDDLLEARFETTTPAETLQRVIEFFMPHADRLAALGIGSFGPLDLHEGSVSWGYITSTPKPGWANTDIAGILGGTLELPVAIDTDVNAAALAEGCWGAASGLSDYVYYTIGTGIGGGVVSGGKLVHGLVHPELGHCFLAKHPEDTYAGACSYHGSHCFEGLASGPAIAGRWQARAETLPEDHPAWQLQAWYIGHAMVNTICSLSPQKIILGGGVMAQAQLLPLVRKTTLRKLNGYVKHTAILENIENYIVSPALGDRAGIVGAIELAKNKGAGTVYDHTD